MTNEELERLEALAMAVADDSGKKLFFSHAQFRNAANPQAILSLIQRVREAVAMIDLAMQNTAEIARRASEVRREALEEAAKVAELRAAVYLKLATEAHERGSYATEQKARNKAEECINIAQVIRALGEKAG